MVKPPCVAMSWEAAWPVPVPPSLSYQQLHGFSRFFFFHLFLPKPVTHYHSKQRCFYLFRSSPEETGISLPQFNLEEHFICVLQRMAVHLLTF